MKWVIPVKTNGLGGVWLKWGILGVVDYQTDDASFTRQQLNENICGYLIGICACGFVNWRTGGVMMAQNDPPFVIWVWQSVNRRGRVLICRYWEWRMKAAKWRNWKHKGSASQGGGFLGKDVMWGVEEERSGFGGGSEGSCGSVRHWREGEGDVW